MPVAAGALSRLVVMARFHVLRLTVGDETAVATSLIPVIARSGCGDALQLVSQWKRGEKRPRGPSLKLLTLVAKNGLASVASLRDSMGMSMAGEVNTGETNPRSSIPKPPRCGVSATQYPHKSMEKTARRPHPAEP